MMHAERLPGRGLTAHYFFTFGVEVQLVGDRKNTRVEQRILHLDVAAAALKLIQKGSVRVFLRFDAINQIVFDDVEPRSVLISCRDDRRYFVVFQSAEDNLVFRTACADLATNRLEMNRFQRSVLKKGQLMKRGKAGTLFGERYAILTPRKLFILHGKVAVFPSNAISLEEATPRFDDAKGTIHLDVCGKEYVFQGTGKEESQEWFVEVARAATSRVPILQWDDATAAKMHAEAEQLAADEEEQDEELQSMQGPFPNLSSGGTASPSHFTSPDDWEEGEETPDHHLEAPKPPDLNPNLNLNYNSRGSRSEPHMQQVLGGSGFRGTSTGGSGLRVNTSGGSALTAAAAGQGIGRGVPGSFSSSGGSYVDAAGNVIRLGSGAARTLGSGESNSVNGGFGAGSRSLKHTWSGSGQNPRTYLNQHQSPMPLPGGFNSGRSGSGRSDGVLSNGSTPRSSSGWQQQQAAMHNSLQQQQQQQHDPMHIGSSNAAGGVLGTILESGESDYAAQNYSTAEEVSAAETAALLPAAGEQLQQQRGVVPPAPPLRLSKLLPKQQQQQQNLPAGPGGGKKAAGSSGGNASRKSAAAAADSRSASTIAAAAVTAAASRAVRQQQRQQVDAEAHRRSSPPDEFFADYDGDAEGDTQENSGDVLSADEQEVQSEAEATGDEQSDGEQQQQPQPLHRAAAAARRTASVSRAPAAPRSSSKIPATAAAAAGRRSSPTKGTAGDKPSSPKTPLRATGGFMSPGTEVDLEALTEAVTGRTAAAALERNTAAQQQQQKQQQQQRDSIVGPLWPVGNCGSSCSAPHCTSCPQQQHYSPGVIPTGGLHSGVIQRGMSSTDYSYGLSPQAFQYNNIKYSPCSSQSVGLYNQPPAGMGMTNPHGMTNPQAGLHSGSPSGYYHGSPAAAAAAAAGSTFSSTGSPTRHTVNWGSGPGALSTSSAGAKPYDSNSGWGRKSLAGLYSSNKSLLSGDRVGLIGGSSGSLASDHNLGQSTAAAGGGGSSSSSSRPTTAAAAAASRGVVLGEYIIPSVLKIIVYCPEGRQLAAGLGGEQDLTPHQRNLALMRWAFGVYQRLPEDACMAVPSGPSRHHGKTWITPDINALASSIYQTQAFAKQQQQQQQQDWLQQQQQQQQQHLPGSPGSPTARDPVAASVAGLLAAVGAGSPWQQQQQQLMFGGPMFPTGFADPGWLGLVERLLGQTATSPAIQLAQLLAALGGGSSSSSTGGGDASSRALLERLLAALKEAVHQDKHQANAAAAATVADSSRPASPAGKQQHEKHTHSSCCHCGHKRQQQQQHSAPNHAAGAASSNRCSVDADKCAADTIDRCLSSISSSSTDSSSNCSTCSYCTRQQQQQREATKRPSKHSNICALMNPNLNITVRLKKPQWDCAAAAAAPAAENNVNTAAAGGSSSYKPRNHRLHGRCSFTCDHPLFQLDMGRHSAAAAGGGGDNVLYIRQQGEQQQQQQQCVFGVQPMQFTAIRANTSSDNMCGGSSSSSSDSRNRCSNSSGALCYLSPAAAETICQAASTAAAAAAAAVRSAVGTIEGDCQPPAAARTSGGWPLRPASIQSLVGQVQSGVLDAAGFVETVAAGRAGGLLRPRGSAET